MSKLRDCAVCGQPVTAKPYQAITARACSPVCAHTLAAREHPELLRSRLDWLDESHVRKVPL